MRALTHRVTYACLIPDTPGLILYLLSFFTLPYHNADDDDLLEKEIRAYPGCASSQLFMDSP